MTNILLKLGYLVLIIGILGVLTSEAQIKNICDCWEQGKVKVETINCSSENLSEADKLKVMECLIKQKGNRIPYFGTILKDNISQIFAPARLEVVALFQMSYLFYGENKFASAVVLVDNKKDDDFNSKASINSAYRSYQKWFGKIKKIGFEEARKQKLDPLEGSGVRWY